MAIKSINVNTTGLIGSTIDPRRVTIITTDNLATVTSSGYLNGLISQGYSFLPSDIFHIWYSWNEVSNTGIYGEFYVTFSGLVPTLNIFITQYLSSPFYVNGIPVTSTASQLNLLNAMTAVPINKLFRQIFNTAGTYTYDPTFGMVWCMIECISAGGAGGGITSNVARADTASGGGGGAYVRSFFSAAEITTTQTVTVGAGGAPGAPGNNDGNFGGDSFVGTLIHAGGAFGGGGGAGELGGQGGSLGSFGDVVIFGQTGGSGSILATTAVAVSSGCGGNPAFGGGGGTTNTLAQNGNSGVGYGAGGAGANGFASSTPFSGGAGTSGIVIITEYLSI